MGHCSQPICHCFQRVSGIAPQLKSFAGNMFSKDGWQSRFGGLLLSEAVFLGCHAFVLFPLYFCAFVLLFLCAIAYMLLPLCLCAFVPLCLCAFVFVFCFCFLDFFFCAVAFILLLFFAFQLCYAPNFAFMHSISWVCKIPWVHEHNISNPFLSSVFCLFI